MLETICISSLLWSINICSGIESEKEVLKAIEVKNVSNIVSDKIYLAQGRPYESDYERDTQREREQRDIWNHGESQSDREEDPDEYRHRDRNDREDYRREVENERIYRDPDGRSDRDDDDNDGDDYRREAETERIYRDLDRDDREDYRREVENDWIYRQRDR